MAPIVFDPEVRYASFLRFPLVKASYILLSISELDETLRHSRGPGAEALTPSQVSPHTHRSGALDGGPVHERDGRPWPLPIMAKPSTFPSCSVASGRKDTACSPLCYPGRAWVLRGGLFFCSLCNGILPSMGRSTRHRVSSTVCFHPSVGRTVLTRWAASFGEFRMAIVPRPCTSGDGSQTRPSTKMQPRSWLRSLVGTGGANRSTSPRSHGLYCLPSKAAGGEYHSSGRTCLSPTWSTCLSPRISFTWQCFSHRHLFPNPMHRNRLGEFSRLRPYR